MAERTSLYRRAARLAPLLALVAGCTPPPQSPELWTRCFRDYLLWSRYNYHYTVNGQKLRAEYALYQCQMSRYWPAIAELEDILWRMKVPAPLD